MAAGDRGDPMATTNGRRAIHQLARLVTFITVFVLLINLFPASGLTASGYYDERLGAIAGPDTFGLTLWTVDAFAGKFAQIFGQKPAAGMTADQKQQVFQDFFASADDANSLEGQINDLRNRGTPADDPHLVDLEQQLKALRQKRQSEAPLVNSTIDEQVQAILKQQGISLLQNSRLFVPPVFSKLIDLPNVLVIAYRDSFTMRQQVPVRRTMTTEEIEVLESTVDKDLNVSSLVVPIGGYSTYPTMIASTGPRDWMVGVVSHEWCHIYLMAKPLGQNYNKNGEVAAMNETVCSLFGDEVSATVLETYYGEAKKQLSWQVPPTPTPAPTPTPVPGQQPEPQPFNANRELGKIYQAADARLKAGDIDGADAVMEQGREYLAANGFYIRKLNTAFFAFYGSYAEGPESIRSDPLGDDLRQLRRESPSLHDFMLTVSQMTSYDDLKQRLGK
jgi:hypothetical protein